MNGIISQWIPPNERSRFMSAYMGGSVGIALFYPIFGFITTISSWEWIFHFSTVMVIIWFIIWQYCVYDSPAQHPRIDLSELNYITETIGDSVQKDRNVGTLMLYNYGRTSEYLIKIVVGYDPMEINFHKLSILDYCRCIMG